MSAILNLEIIRTGADVTVKCPVVDENATPTELAKAALLLEGVANTLRKAASK